MTAGQWATAVLSGSTWIGSAIGVRQALHQGLPIEEVAAKTGIALAILHRWLISLEVLESLDMSVIGDCSPILQEDETSETLYALRQLPLDARSVAARYMLERRLPASAADELIQAIKDCRRLGARDGFTCEPGNALAFKKWQKALFSRLPEERQRYLREGLELAATERVRSLFQRAMEQDFETGSSEKERSGPTPWHITMRWVGTKNPWPRLIPYCDDLQLVGDLRLQEMQPRKSDGLWYDVPAGRYVAVPGWPEVVRLSSPIAVPYSASIAPLLGMVFPGEDNALLIIETHCEEPDTPLGKIALVVRRVADDSALPFPPDDDGADLDFLD